MSFPMLLLDARLLIYVGPALLDRYANWKDKKYPVPKTSVVQVTDGGKES